MDERREIREILISPEIARQYLTHNKCNRPLRTKMVDYYAQQMSEGRWKPNGATITFATNGYLVDGQTRLHAIIKSGKTIPMLVVKNVVFEDAFATTDVGTPRSAADLFAIENIDNYTNTSAGISRLMSLRKGFVPQSKVFAKSLNLDKARLLEEYKKYPAVFDELSEKAKEFAKKFKLIRASEYFGFMAYLIIDKNHRKETVYRFFLPLALGENFPNKSVKLLRDILANNSAGRTKMNPLYRQNLIAKAWNYYIKGADVSRIGVSATEKLDFI